MANRDIKIVTEALSQDLLTLDEYKTWTGIPLTDTSRDEQLTLQISSASAICADICNRKPTLGFGEEEVIETWREIGSGRLYLSHWPIKDPDGIISVSWNGGTLLLPDVGYDLEGYSGKIDVFGSWQEPAVVHYIGGYKLPDEAPLPLKRACVILIQEERIRNQQAQTSGIRQLRHKEAMVSFFDPNALLLKSVGAKSVGMQTAEALLRPYMRHEV